MNHNSLRYSIASVLFVCFVVAGTFAGYRAGFSEGYASGKAKRQAEDPFPKIYEVGGLLRSVTDPDDSKTIDEQRYIDPLMQAVQNTVHPAEWKSLGGECSMTPLPWRECLVVNATSGVHRQLQSFFDDLASVKVAVADARQEGEAARRANQERVMTALQPVEKSLGTTLEPIAGDDSLIGVWEVRPSSAETHPNPARYTFVDEDSVTIDLAEQTAPTETWYATLHGAVVISGKPYIAAWTADQNLVLVQQNAPNAVIVAERIQRR